MSARARITQTFKRLNFNTIEHTFTLNDPKTYTSPVDRPRHLGARARDQAARVRVHGEQPRVLRRPHQAVHPARRRGLKETVQMRSACAVCLGPASRAVAVVCTAALVSGLFVAGVSGSTGPIPLDCNRACLEGVIDQYLKAAGRARSQDAAALGRREVHRERPAAAGRRRLLEDRPGHRQLPAHLRGPRVRPGGA